MRQSCNSVGIIDDTIILGFENIILVLKEKDLTILNRIDGKYNKLLIVPERKLFLRIEIIQNATFAFPKPQMFNSQETKIYTRAGNNSYIASKAIKSGIDFACPSKDQDCLIVISNQKLAILNIKSGEILDFPNTNGMIACGYSPDLITVFGISSSKITIYH